MEKREVQAKYNRVARWYDLADAVPELLGLRGLRRWLAQLLRGRVVEVACGTGKNFRFYPPVQHPIGVDLSLEMLKVARSRAQSLGLVAHFAVMDGEELAIRDQAADTVLSSMTLCTFPEPIQALKEMARICRRDGQILLLDHGRSDRPWLGRWQDRRAARHARRLGCQWNREPLDLVREAGLTIDWAQREKMSPPRRSRAPRPLRRAPVRRTTSTRRLRLKRASADPPLNGLAVGAEDAQLALALVEIESYRIQGGWPPDPSGGTDGWSLLWSGTLLPRRRGGPATSFQLCDGVKLAHATLLTGTGQSMEGASCQWGQWPECADSCSSTR